MERIYRDNYFNKVYLYRVLSASTPALVIRMFLSSWHRESSSHMKVLSSVFSKKKGKLALQVSLCQNDSYAQVAYSGIACTVTL